jgi:hypothetical protein
MGRKKLPKNDKKVQLQVGVRLDSVEAIGGKKKASLLCAEYAEKVGKELLSRKNMIYEDLRKDELPIGEGGQKDSEQVQETPEEQSGKI